ncbi:unnamed protein product [Diamesa tonsa]
MSADKVPCLVLTEVSEVIINAWKNPKKLKWTTGNQFRRCVKYYVETTINNMLPLIKNIEQFSFPKETKYSTIIKANIGKKKLLDEARVFLGNVELTKRTRGQQKKIYTEVESSPSRSSDTIQVPKAKRRKRKISLEHQVTGYNDLSIPSSTNLNIVVKPMQTSSNSCESLAIASTSKNCTPPSKAVKRQLETSNNDKTSLNKLDMPELSGLTSCQEIELKAPDSIPKFVLKINRLSDHYQGYSDGDHDERATSKPECSKNVTKTVPHNTSSLTNNVCTGVGIGYKDIEIIKPGCKKRKVKASSDMAKAQMKEESKPPVIKKTPSGKMTKPRNQLARNLITFPDSVDIDDQLEKTQTKETRCDALDGEENKPSTALKRKIPTRRSRNSSTFSETVDSDNQMKKAHIKVTKPRKQLARNYSEATDSNSQMTNVQIKKESKPSAIINIVTDFDASGKVKKAKLIKPRQKPARNQINYTDSSDSDAPMVKSQKKESRRDSSEFGKSKDKRDFGDMFGEDFYRNNEVIQNDVEKFTTINGEIVNKSIHERNNKNNECKDLAKNIEECSSNVTNKNTSKSIVNNSNYADDCSDDSDIISFCADEDFDDDFTFEEKTPIAPKKITSFRPIDSTTAWSASLDDCKMTIRRDSVNGTPNVLNNAGLTNLGILKYKAIRICIENATDSIYAKETITSMIAETGPDVVRFVDYLKHCGALPIPLFNKIMEHCVTYQNPDLQYFLLSEFQKIQLNSFHIDSPQVNLTAFTKLIGLIKRSQTFNNTQDELLDVLQNVCSI